MPTLLLTLYVAAGLTLRQVVDPGGDALLDQTSIPWWAQVGLNTTTIGALIAFFIWQNKQVSNGRWYPEPIVTKMLEEKDATIAGLNAQLAGQAVLIEEQRVTIRAGESTADTLAKALVQSTSNQGWVDVLVQRALGGNALTPKTGDNTPEGVPQ